MIYVIVEGITDKYIIEKILEKYLSFGITFVIGGGGYSSVKLASSIMMNRNAPTILVMDSDESGPDAEHNKNNKYKDILHSYKNKTSFKIVIFNPNIESEILKSISPGLIEKKLFRKNQNEVKALIRNLEKNNHIDFEEISEKSKKFKEIVTFIKKNININQDVY